MEKARPLDFPLEGRAKVLTPSSCYRRRNVTRALGQPTWHFEARGPVVFGRVTSDGD